MKHSSFQSFDSLIPESAAMAAARRPRPSSDQSRPRSRAGRQARRERILNNAFPGPETGDINQEQFNRLLGWLDPDREKAGLEYERIRKGLIKNFVSRGAHNPEELADRTIDRVARTLPRVQANYVGDPAHYFSSVAGYILLEALRKERIPSVRMPEPALPDSDDEKDNDCLEKCVAELPAADRDLLLTYYQHEKQAKIEHRRKMAEQFGVGINALRIRACRLRLRLQESMQRRRSAGGEIVRTQTAN